MPDMRVFLYFKSKDDADAAAQDCGEGWRPSVQETEQDGWVVTATKDFEDDEIDNSIADVEAEMGRIAQKHGGDYDGFDRAVGRG